MADTLHITSGDIAGARLARAGLPGEVFVWHDILYDGPRNPGWPDEENLTLRSLFLEEFTAGGLNRSYVLETLHGQYRKLTEAAIHASIVLWFDACLFDQSMLAHILTCLRPRATRNVELLCVDSFPGIDPFNGLGQLLPEQLASLYDGRRPVSEEQLCYAVLVDAAFATQNAALLTELSVMETAPLPRVPAAAARWLLEQPDPASGLGRLEYLALSAICNGCETPGEIFTSVAGADTPPQFWGDTTLWSKINGLADRDPPLVRIEGPRDRLPQWQSEASLKEFKISALSNQLLQKMVDSRR